MSRTINCWWWDTFARFRETSYWFFTHILDSGTHLDIHLYNDRVSISEPWSYWIEYRITDNERDSIYLWNHINKTVEYEWYSIAMCLHVWWWYVMSCDKIEQEDKWLFKNVFLAMDNIKDIAKQLSFNASVYGGRFLSLKKEEPVHIEFSDWSTQFIDYDYNGIWFIRDNY